MTTGPKTLGSRLRYQQVMDRIEQDIRSGNYLPGYKLPSVVELSQSLGANHITVRKGMKELQDKGLLEIRPRVGVFVTSPRPERKKKIIKIALAFRAYMLDISKNHPAVAAFQAGAYRRCPPTEFNIQSLFYKENRLIEDIGEAILAQGIDGVVICGGGVREADYDFFRSHKIHLVDCSLQPQPDDYAVKITLNGALALRQAVEHLRGLGHNRIAFLTWDRYGDGGLVHRTFAQLAFEHQLGDPRELMIRMENPEGDAHWEHVERFFDLVPRPTGVIVPDEFVADVFLASCHRREIRIPRDVSLAAMHDLMPYGHRVPLTAGDGIRNNTRATFLACEIIARLMEGKPVPKRQISITPRLVAKASTGPVGLDTA